MQESYSKEETVGIMWPLSGYYELVLIQLLGYSVGVGGEVDNITENDHKVKWLQKYYAV